VSDDGIVSALDALLIINDINTHGARDLRGTNTPYPPYIDVTGDNFVSALDVLQVVNYVNSRGGGSGEGEFAPPSVAAIDHFWSNHGESDWPMALADLVL
jgi:hypothetical protein